MNSKAINEFGFIRMKNYTNRGECYPPWPKAPQKGPLKNVSCGVYFRNFTVPLVSRVFGPYCNKMFIIWLLPVWGIGNKFRTRDLTVI